jgi:ABC-type Mn2+/Zn2+ transport system permease subunit
VHFVFRKKFLAISFDPPRAEQEGLSIRGWDFLFYALFGIVVTTFVHIGGVLLVFSYLIIPAACANFLVRQLVPLLAIGCAISTLGSVAGIYCSGAFNWPVGAAIVCVLGVVLLLAGAASKLRRA